MKLGHNIGEKKRNHTYHSFISNSQVAWHLRSTVWSKDGFHRDQNDSHFQITFKENSNFVSVTPETEGISYISCRSCVSLVQPRSWAVTPRRGGQLFPFSVAAVCQPREVAASKPLGDVQSLGAPTSF